MKTVVLTYDNIGALPEAYLMPDSALLQSGKPFFVPDFASEFVAMPHLVLRIGRLGKSISERFAHRYYDAVAPGLAVRAKEMSPAGFNGAFDGATIVGNFTPIDEADRPAIARFTVDGVDYGEAAEQKLPMSFDKIISYISQYFTLKMGDLIFTGSTAAPIPLVTDTKIQASLGATPSLNCKIK